MQTTCRYDDSPKGNDPGFPRRKELMVTADYCADTHADQLLMQEGPSMSWSSNLGIVIAN